MKGMIRAGIKKEAIAGSESRTLTRLRAKDFESFVSTIPPSRHKLFTTIQECTQKIKRQEVYIWKLQGTMLY